MTTLKDFLNDFALDIIHNIVKFKDSEDGDIDYDKDGLEDLENQYIDDISKRLLGKE